ncbi:DUF4034 domain-containing protein [Niveibacterium microcysteis]|uniref:DUF4034 domain-containing protein n=1 Tax=Niveibacterium microcysteis TaxID=2811415 RepID=A0ABX7M746_9RHOO|nr:DUF4034 domain-containing protein [Niveibacterium microcysteis]QSI75272.1 DUF4034 domain-containing protein [Niveibacterium microcysteis]
MENEVRLYTQIFTAALLIWSCACHSEGVDVQEALRAKQFEAIEKVLNARESEFKQGKLGEYDILDAYKPFYQSEDVFSNELNDWIHKKPNSYIAHLARGTYYRKLGEFRRGTRYIQQTPAENVRFMHQQFEIAKTDLRKALSLNPRSFLAILNLLNIELQQGDEKESALLLREGTKLYPHTLLLRARYMVHLQPRWGGSYEAMDAFLRQSRAEGAPDPVLNLLMAIKLDDIGFTSEEHRDYDSAHDHYQRALALCRAADRRFISSYVLHAADWCSRNC